MTFGVVVIGRNEGDRLKSCLASLPSSGNVVYVDSGSTDGSTQWAQSRGVEVVELNVSEPCTAARARNSGFNRLRAMVADPTYVQFIDGDCRLSNGWLECAVDFLDAHPDVGAVCGWRREQYPEKSIYNWLCDQDWNGPAGEAHTFGGDVMIRVSALEDTGGYRDDLIAGEDPELCVRMRAAGWRIWRLNADMTLHDAAMTRFVQWWQRAVRSGYAFEQGAYLHGTPPEYHCVYESRRAWFWGAGLPLVCLAAGLFLGGWGWTLLVVYPLHILQKLVRNKGSLRDRALLALFHVLGHFPQSWGQLKFRRDRMLGYQPRLIEYK